jgi:hypothetical protein
MSKTVTVETAPARTAIEAVAFSKEKFDRSELELTSTGGLQNNTRAIWRAIEALAMFVDGASPTVTHQIVVPDHYEVDAKTGELRPAVVEDQERQVVAA